MLHNLKAVFFDLDGTLLDTAPDMAEALNIQLEAHKKKPLPHSDIRPYVSHGAAALIKLGFDVTPEQAEFEALRRQYLNIYSENLAHHTRPFDGISELLEALERNKIKWGVVTNKPAFLTEPLLKQLDLYDRCSSVISVGTVTPSKPSPLPLFVACKDSQVIATQSIYVGDAKRDIAAGKAAGMKTILAHYGYIQPEDDINQWGADWVVNHASELQPLILNKAPL